MEVFKPVGFPRYVVVGAVSVLAVALSWLVYTWPVTVQYFPTYAVTYSKGLGQSFELEVVNETGHPVHFCASMYGWLPNGSFAEIGHGCGVGRRSFDPRALRQYAETWRGYRGVEPGVVVLLTYVNGTKPDGKPALARAAKGFTIQPERVAQGENVKATIKVKAKPPKEDRKTTEQTGAKFGPSLQRPPGKITENCMAIDRGVAICTEWRLDRVYYSALDSKVPTAAARIKSYSDAYYINSVRLLYWIDATTDVGVYFNAGAAISAESEASVSTSYSADVYSIVLKNTRLSNRTSTTFYPPIKGPGVYVVGFYGDVALARFKEYEVLYPGGYSNPTGYIADIYLVRPSAARMQRNVLAVFQDMDPTPTDDYGYSQIFNTLWNYWAPNYRWDDTAILVDSTAFVEEGFTISFLSFAIPILRTAQAVSPKLTASAGGDVSFQSTVKIYTQALLDAQLKAEYITSLDIAAYVYSTSAWFEYGNKNYYIPTVLVDIFIPRG